MIVAKKEFILPGGGFASLRGLTGQDLLRMNACQAKDPSQDGTFLLISFCATIDEKPVSYEELNDMDIRDVLALQKELGQLIGGPIT